MSDLIDDRRNFSRVHIEAGVSLELPDGTTAVGQATDLSMNGIAFRCAVAVEAGTTGNLALVYGQTPDAIVVRARARVAWCRDGCVGVQLVEVDLDSYHHLRHLVIYNADELGRVQQELDAHVGLKRR